MELNPLYVEDLKPDTLGEIALRIRDKLENRTFVYVQGSEATTVPTVSVGNKLSLVSALEPSEDTNGYHLLWIKFEKELLVFNADTNVAIVQIYTDRVVIILAGDSIRGRLMKSFTLFLQD